MASRSSLSLSRWLAALVTLLALSLTTACSASGDDQGGDAPGTDDVGQSDQVTPDTTDADLAGQDQAGPDGTDPDVAGPDTPVDDTITPDVPADVPPDTPADVPTVTCSSCHGSAINAAPPVDTAGNSDTTVVTVGAHQSHLGLPSGISVPVTCDQCHAVPAAVGDAGHLDASPAELTFGSLAAADGATPAWDRTAATCSSVYCHGATLNGGGSNQQPQWTKVDGTQAACGSCHGLPPPAPHAQNDDCGACHTATATGQAIAHPDKHIDGVVEVETANLACNACHGSDANNAPPVDTKGNTSTTMPSVGAHQAHLTAPSGLAAPLTCDQCHVVPATSDAAGHIDEGPAEVTFGALAKTGGANATWTHANASCATTYCHGATLKGGTVPAPTWTKVDGTQDACGACHAISPKTGRHPSNYGKHAFIGKDCTKCHEGQTNTSGTSITNAALHLNGAKDVKLQSGGTWNAANKSCNPSCHGNENW